MATIDDIQLLSLVDNPIENEFHANRIDQQQLQVSPPRRSSFWKGLFQRRRGGEQEQQEEDLEGSALLDSCPDLQFDSRREDDEELDDYRDGEGNSSHRARLLQSNDSEDDDDDELYYNNGEVWSGKNKGTVTSTNDVRNMHSSAPVLKYSPRANDTVNDESESDDDEEDDDDDDEEDESGDDDDEEVNDYEPIRYQPPQRAATSPVQPLRKFLQRSQSVSSQSYYSDNRSAFGDDGLSVDTSNRKNIHGRIQGFGNDPPRTPTQVSDPLPAARNLRQRLLDLTSAYRMRKMAIGTEESLQRKTWVERFDEVVDRVLPPDPELDGYIDAFKITGQAIVVMPHEEPSDPEDNDTPLKKSAAREPQSRGKAGAISHRRQELGDIDDAAYIAHLECELQNKELELNSWKRRIKELEAEVQRLKGLRDEGDEESQGSSSDSSSKEDKDPGESEIEWQTGVVEEGVLIDVESSPPESMVDQEKVTTQSKLSTLAEAATFVMSHAPDGPNGDEEAAIGPRPLEKDETKYDNDDDFFPVLSSKNRESATMWMDETSIAKPSEPSSPLKVGPTESMNISNDKDDEEEEDQSDEGEEDDDEDDDDDEEEEVDDKDDDNDDDDEEEEEEEEESEEKAEEGDLVPPKEDLLIILDDPQETLPTSTVDMGVAVVSDDEDGGDKHATKNSSDEPVLDGSTISSIIKDPQLDGSPTTVQSDMTLIDLGS